MKIVVHDTAAAMADLLRRPPAERPDSFREMLAPLQRMMPPGAGLDLAQQYSSGTGLLRDRDDPRLPTALRQMEEANVWGRVEDALTTAWDRIRTAVPGIKHAETVHVALVLGDPDDDHLVRRSAGYLGFGGIPGAIVLVMWPTATSLRKIPHAAAHELHHNVRYANVVWNPMTVTVGEHVISEGLAEAFVRELAGEEAMGPWATALTGADLDAAYEKIAAAVDVAGMANLTPYVFGDATARLTGQEPVGLPDFAGYAAGLRIADAHLTATGLTAAHSTALPAREILTNAGIPTTA
ncbi:peptidase [Streptomyces sp. NRRL F-4489]|uniref:DUF2268 domain-containing protein n=1 Tax=Streptomyces sp. NRRL F-4489 TaxID=1609095 RepID=UPI0007488750|nr:DUF2268 domain-containing putative Zn-dependent protease [Streptomyces sp. NRRL F-4489]KUL35654.1 peptidase [Streptomyces sp. NRRL F-4489]